MNLSERLRSGAGQAQAGVVISLLTVAAYMAAYLPLRQLLGNGTTSLVLIPVAVVAWNFGVAAGVSVSLLLALYSTLIIALTGEPVETMLFEQGGFVGFVALVVIAAFIGAARQLRRRLVRELHRHQQTEEALQRRTAELQARNAELDAFARTVAHELKNPLCYVVAYTDMLREDWDDGPPEELHEYVDNIERSAARMNRIIDELLLLASVQTVDEIAIEPLDMEEIVAEALKRLHPAIERRKAEIRLPDAWPVALGHAAWIEEVWVNYLSNALKYGGRPPRVELGAEHLPDGTVRFWVRDNGPGLTPEEQARLFTPFTRLGFARGRGHGLGLSIVQQITSKLGGRADVESKVGEGSTFRFVLPAAPKSSREST